MTALLPVIGVLIAAAITPGPNNFLVLEAGARRGALAAGRAIAGVVIGSLLLLALVWTGLGVAMQTAPLAQLLLSVAGALYLGWLGAAMFASAAREGHAAPAHKPMPTTFLGIAAFQILNPKAWVLVTTAAAAMAGAGGFVVLALLVVLISSLCLALWALAGRALSRFLERPEPRFWFDRAMGGLLALSALGLIVDAFI
jgi:threonine/homoserine/homoserine lactone efflux protein